MLQMSSKVRTIEEAIDDKTTGTINSVTRQAGLQFSEAVLMGWLVHLNELLALKRPMTEQQIEYATHMIISDFGSLKFSDLTLLFSQIIKGQHGEFYESLGIDKILKIFANYFEQRCDIAANRSISKNIEIKQGLAEVSTERKSTKY
jgi:hypothetical protein